MVDRLLNWGILSTARINRALIPPLRKSNRNRLLAVASRDSERAGAYAQEWDIPRFYGSYEELLADPEIDVVYNSLPNSLHADWTIKAAEAGKHVLCEKPLAVSVEEVDAVASAAKRCGVKVAEAFMYRHHAQTHKVKALVEEGAIGALQMVRGHFSFTVDHPGNVRLNPGLAGGSVWDVGCYPISYARYLVGEDPQEVFGWQVKEGAGVDELFMGQLRFANGVLAQFDCSLRSPNRGYMEAVGSGGWIRVPSPYKPEYDEKIILRRGAAPETVEIPGEDLYLGEVEDLASAILDGSPTRISLADSRGNVATIVALLQSAAEGRPVAVPPSS